MTISSIHVPCADWLNEPMGSNHWSSAAIGYGRLFGFMQIIIGHVMHAVHLLSTIMDAFDKHALSCAGDRSAVTQRLTGVR